MAKRHFGILSNLRGRVERDLPAARFFARITTEAIRRGSFSSVRQLQAAIDAYLAEHNKEPKPFTWTASADSIFRKLEELPFLN